MNDIRSPRLGLAQLGLALLGLAAALSLTLLVSHRQPRAPQSESVNAAPVPSNSFAGAGPGQSATNANTGPTTPPLRAGFRLRPFAATNESTVHQWTSEDGMAPDVIEQLAHNELEYQRMIEENSRIKRRQLVYRKDTSAALMQRARLSGESVTQLTLPGFDGQEFQIDIDRADLEASKQSGTFTGRLTDKPNSLVTLAFKFGREAFTVLSPEDGLFLQGHPREPGEIIVTSFDPDTYSPLPGGEPIRTAQK